MALISTRDFSFAFPGAEPILHNVNLSIDEGGFAVLLGPNGSGKTTLLQQLHPVLAAAGERSGDILWRGESVSRETSSEVARNIGFVMQRPESQVVTDKVWHELAFGLENQGMSSDRIRQKVAEIATYFGIEGWFDKDVSELSGGQRQILNLASVMVLDPTLLILDEPTAQLDPISADNFILMLHRLNYELGVTILAAEHELQKILPNATQVLLLSEGELALSAPPQQAIPEIMERYPELAPALPVSAQIYAAAAHNGVSGSSDVPGENATLSPLSPSAQSAVPLTVGEGKRWLNSVLPAAEPAGGMAPSPVVSGANSGRDMDGDIAAATDITGKEPAAIRAQEVWFRYDKGSPDLLQGLNLTVRKGEIFALVGANGSGKSTFVSVLSGVQRPYRGRIELAGTPLKKFAPGALYRNFLGVLPQDPQTLFVQKTVVGDLEDVFPKRGVQRDEMSSAILSGAESLGLMEVLERHPYDLSGGEQQLTALLKVLLLKPQILLLDEPTKGMDEAAKSRVIAVLKALQKRGVTVLFVTHDVEFAAQCADRAGMFFHGDVVSEDRVGPFFSRNNFYTTSASRIARDHFPMAITKDEVIQCVRKQMTL
ncbi:MAG: ATP-binding cassette domain-containing protein [Bifidobacteriaceae bacterium]|jgi:energy-coupling factor transport system ATP-binding protein|nr:ATP-binding cassette domain-containing protein [Bifidobacteriaceae bacterium]